MVYTLLLPRERKALSVDAPLFSLAALNWEHTRKPTRNSYTWWLVESAYRALWEGGIVSPASTLQNGKER